MDICKDDDPKPGPDTIGDGEIIRAPEPGKGK